MLSSDIYKKIGLTKDPLSGADLNVTSTAPVITETTNPADPASDIYKKIGVNPAAPVKPITTAADFNPATAFGPVPLIDTKAKTSTPAAIITPPDRSVRLPFNSDKEKVNLPSYTDFIPGLKPTIETASSLIELIPRVATKAISNVREVQGKDTTLPFDASRLGFEPGNKVPTSGKDYIAAIQKTGFLDDPSIKNLPKAVLAAGLTAGFDIFDALNVGGVIKSIADAVVKNVAVSAPEHIAVWKGLGMPKTVEDAKATANKLLIELSNETKGGLNATPQQTNTATNIINFSKIIEKQGIPKDPGPISQATRDIARFFNTDVTDLHNFKFGVGADVQAPFVKTAGLLPGNAPENPAPAMGLSVQRVNKVGGEFIPSTAEDIIKAKKLDPASVSIIDNSKSLVEALDGSPATLVDLPISVFGKPKFTTLNQDVYKPGRQIKDPIEAILKDGKYIITDGANRFSQAIANGDSSIPTVLINQSTTKIPVYEGSRDLTLKTLQKLEGRSTVSKQFISDLTNSGDIKQAERDAIRATLSEYPDGKDIPVKEFADKVQNSLLPLTRSGDEAAYQAAKAEKLVIFNRQEASGLSIEDYFNKNKDEKKLLDAVNKKISDAKLGAFGGEAAAYESIVLPENIRGDVKNYSNHIYQSPIKTAGGSIHFSGIKDAKNYFAHSRTEDMADDSTRRVIEIQSDLFQKGRLDEEQTLAGTEINYNGEKYTIDAYSSLSDTMLHIESMPDALGNRTSKPIPTEEIIKQNPELIKISDNRSRDLVKLEPYRNTWQDRIIREEVKQAAKDGKTKLQFPTGETAMDIEGLGDNSKWFNNPNGEEIQFGNNLEVLKPDTKLSIGQIVGSETHGDTWVITDVLGDGKFRAAPKSKYEEIMNRAKTDGATGNELERIDFNYGEEFNISGKVDTNNPIYKFYEKEVGKYVVNKFGAKKITDDKGVTWWEIPVKKEWANLPIDAFGFFGGVSQDDKGNIQFDPTRALLGFAAGSIMRRGGKFEPLAKTIRSYESPSLFVEAFKNGLLKTALTETIMTAGKDISQEVAAKSAGEILNELKPEAKAVIEADGGDKLDGLDKYLESLYEEANKMGKVNTKVPETAAEIVDDGKDFAQIENNVGRYVEANKEILAQDYVTRFGNVFNVDNYKELIPGHSENRTISEAFHRPAAQQIGEMIKNTLEADAGSGKDVIIMGGATGAGKSTTLASISDQETVQNAVAILDGTIADRDRTIKNVKLALDTGHQVAMFYIETSPEQLLTNLINRAQSGGRTVPIETAYNTLQSSKQNLFRINGKFSEDSKFSVIVYDNRGATPKYRRDGIAFLKSGLYSDADIASFKKKAYDELKQAYESKQITTKQYEGFTRRKEASKATNGKDSQFSGEEGTVLPQEPKTKTLLKTDLNIDQANADYTKALEAESQQAADIKKFKNTKEEIKNEIEILSLEKSFMEEALLENPARQLSKYQSRSTGLLPEVTGELTTKSISGSGKDVKNSIFGRSGDSIVTELGFLDAEEARKAYELYTEQRSRFLDIKEKLSEKVANYREKKQIIEAVEKDIKRESRSRHNQIKLVQDFFGLDDSEFADITKGIEDYRFMTDARFEGLLKEIYSKSFDAFRLTEARLMVKATIFEKELRKVENLQKAMKLPQLENMSAKQLQDFDKLLESFKNGDEFLGVRQIQTVKNTNLAGIKTKREALEALAKEAGAPIEDIGIIRPSEMDRYLYDVPLARQNPFYKVLVNEANTALIAGEMRYIDLKTTLEKLMKDARGSRKKDLIDKLIPTDGVIFDFLSADAGQKIEIMKSMTVPEVRVAQFIQTKYTEARDYLMQRDQLNRYRKNYITNVRRGFLEAWKAGGIRGGFIDAAKELLDQFKLDEAHFNILDQKTGEVLPLEKFFKYALRRTGELKPSQNVAKAVLSYFRAFENKVALDSIVPKLDIYAHVLTPSKMTPRGLEFDDSLKRFVKEWLNNKKGRVADYGVKAGGKVDWAIRTGIAMTRTIDLGLNVPVGIASNVGENVSTFTNIGLKRYATGVKRYAESNGREIAKKYKGFVGETLIEKMTDISKTLGQKFSEGIFGLFAAASRRANIIHLLGSMTPEEYTSQTISAERLSSISHEIGKYRITPGTESIVGRTAFGRVGLQYKQWAEPIVITTAHNLKTLINLVGSKDFAGIGKSREVHELLRGTLLATIIGLSSYTYYDHLKNKKDKTFIEMVTFKAANDGLSIIGALSPQTLFSTPRLLSFIEDLAKSIDMIAISITTGSRDSKGNIEGTKALTQTVVPKVIRSFWPSEETQTNRAIESAYNTISDEMRSNPSKAKEDMISLHDQYPDVYEKVYKMLLDETRGITPADKLILAMGVANGERARYVFNEMQSKGTNEEKKQYLSDLFDKKIVTREVFDQVTARVIYEKVVKLPTPSEKKKYILDLFDKNAITEDVFNDVSKLIKGGGDYPKFTPGIVTSNFDVLHTVKLYAEAIGIDPLTAFNRIFTGQKIRRIDNGAIIVERMTLSESEAVKKERKSTDDMKLDHTIPLELGGSNAETNLRLVSTAEWKLYTPIENFLASKLKAKDIDKKEAQDLITRFKNGEIDADYIYNNLGQ